jgi:hypothetical protein
MVAGTTRAHFMQKVQQWKGTRAAPDGVGGARSGHEQGTPNAESALGPDGRDGRPIRGPEGCVIAHPSEPVPTGGSPARCPCPELTRAPGCCHSSRPSQCVGGRREESFERPTRSRSAGICIASPDEAMTETRHDQVVCDRSAWHKTLQTILHYWNRCMCTFFRKSSPSISKTGNIRSHSVSHSKHSNSRMTGDTPSLTGGFDPASTSGGQPPVRPISQQAPAGTGRRDWQLDSSQGGTAVSLGIEAQIPRRAFRGSPWPGLHGARGPIPWPRTQTLAVTGGRTRHRLSLESAPDWAPFQDRFAPTGLLAMPNVSRPI